MEKAKESAQKSFIYDPDFADALENAVKSIFEIHRVVQEKFGKYDPDDHYQHTIEVRTQILVNRGFYEQDGSSMKTPYKGDVFGWIEELELAHDLVIWLQRRGEHYGSDEYSRSLKAFL